VVNLCSAMQVAPVVTAAVCGLDTRFESSTATACANVPEVASLAETYSPDSDPNDYDVYSNYTGNGRRLITLPIVDVLSGAGPMNVLGFRQFLLIPAQGTVALNPGDPFGRFVALYAGSVAAVKQGRFDGCTQSAGPGKVVVHQ
jgi:hypothetical protein